MIETKLVRSDSFGALTHALRPFVMAGKPGLPITYCGRAFQTRWDAGNGEPECSACRKAIKSRFSDVR